jgi:hypothetical protein
MTFFLEALIVLLYFAKQANQELSAISARKEECTKSKMISVLWTAVSDAVNRDDSDDSLL